MLCMEFVFRTIVVFYCLDFRKDEVANSKNIFLQIEEVLHYKDDTKKVAKYMSIVSNEVEVPLY